MCPAVLQRDAEYDVENQSTGQCVRVCLCVCVCVHACSECVLYSCKPFLLDDVLERVNVGGYCEFFVFFLSECLCMPACVCVCVWVGVGGW